MPIPEPIITVVKQADDPLALRISCGGRPDVGYYCTYRGNLEECKLVMRVILQSLDRVNESELTVGPLPDTPMRPIPADGPATK